VKTLRLVVDPARLDTAEAQETLEQAAAMFTCCPNWRYRCPEEM
jgi:hypothetical protein